MAKVLDLRIGPMKRSDTWTPSSISNDTTGQWHSNMAHQNGTAKMATPVK